ncbi:MAG TPA: hypothetical protein VJ124_07685 [Pyrinomonadaceae bacterium]|nr:hypothetical protein [Pyrinomonadaceae bacterium]
MKRCPQCRRDYYDDSINFCLEDGSALLAAPSTRQPITEILPNVDVSSESPTRVYRVPDVTKHEKDRSIAVLPFVNLSNDADNEYFSDGLAEDILNVLAHIPGLKVTARTSCFAFRGKEQDIRQIAEALDVKTILEGSVRRAGSRIRVSAQLINAADGYRLWSERYDRELTDVFEVQDEIATAIAGALQLKLTGEIAARQHEPNLPAYEAFLRGRHQYCRFSPEAFASAEEYFKEAVALDQRWADPRSALGDLYFTLGFYGWRPLDEMIPLARDAARTALELLPSDPMAHAVLGAIAGLHDHNWKDAEEQFRLAGASESLPPTGRMLLALFYYSPLGRFDEATQEMTKAIAEDPLNTFWRARQAWILLCAERYEDAIVLARKALEFDDQNYQARMMIALSLGFQGKLSEAREQAEEVFRMAPFDALGTGFLAGLLAKLGEKEKSEKVLAAMTGAIPIGMTIYYLVCSEIESALDWYVKDIEQRRPNGPMIAFAGFAKPLRSSPRWPHLVRMMNLPE